MYALLSGGGVSPRDAAIQKGAAYLLSTQLEDGTWHVERRAFPFQPPMDSGFPHGADGWISAAASSWAVMGLASALDPAKVPPMPATLAHQTMPATTVATSGTAAGAPVDRHYGEVPGPHRALGGGGGDAGERGW